ncbi:hypothetical protein CSUI_008503, partial [Cystoisospora suis]
MLRSFFFFLFHSAKESMSSETESE